MPPSVNSLWALGLSGWFATARNNRNRAVVADDLSDLFAIVRFFGRHRHRWPWCLQNYIGHLTVMSLASCDNEVQRPVFFRQLNRPGFGGGSNS